MATETFNSTTTWTCPLGLHSLDAVRCTGPGGNGAEGVLGVQGGAGGGGGAFALSTDFSVTPGTGYVATVDTFVSWGVPASFPVRAVGGADASGTVGGAGGDGTVCTGDVKHSGGSGGSADLSTGGGGGGEASSATADGNPGGNGTGSAGGVGGTGGDGADGGAGGDLTTAGSNGSLAGGGGGGDGFNFAGSGAGQGAHGRVVIEYTWPTPAPASTTPDNGTPLGGTSVTISGSAFSAGCTVTFGGTPATGVSVTAEDTITCTTPAHATGLVDVVVTNADGTPGTLTDGYTYNDPTPAPASCAPSSGTTDGGTPVTISGTDFSAGCTVTFGGDSATDVVIVNTTTITCVTPAHAAGAVDVVVTTAGGDPGTLVNGYTYRTPAAGGALGGLSGLTGLSMG